LRGPIERLFPNLPNGLRVVIDWAATIVGAVLIVLAAKEWVVNPYRIPSPLHGADVALRTTRARL
jgi:hypothetical protein